MKNHIKLTRSFATFALVTSVLFTITPSIANAQSTNGQSHVGFFQGLLQFIENEFGLSKTQVQTAVQQYQSQRSATITPRPTMSAQAMQDRNKSRLDKLVASNKITADQETAILAELATEQAKYQGSMQNETPQQRRSTMQSMQSDLKTWAQANNINPMYVMSFGGRGNGQGMGRGNGGFGNWGKHTNAPTPQPSS